MTKTEKTHDAATAKQIGRLEQQLERISMSLEAQLADLDEVFAAKLKEAKRTLVEKSNAKAAPLRKMLEALK